MSRNWKGVADLIPGMRNHLRTLNYVKDSREGSTSTGPDKVKTSLDGTEDYSQAFKELFCIAACDLASLIQEPLEHIGVLYDEIISTGTVRMGTKATLLSRTSGASILNDVERGRTGTTFGRGQLLFVVRHTNKLESAHLQAVGFRFAAVPNVIEHLARSMQVTADELSPRLDSMRSYSTPPQILEPGVHLACFALRPLFQRGFDVLVCKGAKNLLPTMSLPIPELSRWHMDFIRRMDDWTVASCLEWLRKTQFSRKEEQHFAGSLFDGITALADQIENPFFQEARLTARPLRAPCRSPSGSQAMDEAMIVGFRVITDVYQSRALNRRFEFTPSRFFLCQQHVYKNSPDHEIFARRIHREFAAVVDRKDAGNGLNPRHSSHGSKLYHPEMVSHMAASPQTPTSRWKWPFPSRDPSPNRVKGDNSSEKNLVEVQSEVPSNPPFGGIHVSNEVTIDVSEVRHGDGSPDIEMKNLGVYSEAGVAPIEKETFVDELMSLTIGERRQQR